jgi:hypothetical protein
MKKAAKPGIDLYLAIATMGAELEDFRIYWEEKRRKDPVNYLDQPTMADWEEQFRAWRELKSEDM